MINHGRKGGAFITWMMVGVLVGALATNTTEVTLLSPPLTISSGQPMRQYTSTTSAQVPAAAITTRTTTVRSTTAKITEKPSTTTSTATTTTTTTPRPPPPPLPKKPHVILMVADDLGWNDVPWNNPKIISPHLGDLARTGVILNQSYVLPTCTPTRAALLTGRYPFTIGMQKGALDPLEPRGLPLRHELLPEVLSKAGYATHAIGKWHLGFCDWRYTPIRRGFDSFYGFFTGSQDYYSHSRTERSAKKRRGQKSKKEYPLDLWNNTKPDHSKKGVYSTYLFASAAERIIRSRNPKNPLFLYLPFQSVHAPMQVPKNYTRVYKHVKDYFRRNYLGMVLAMDDAVGRVVTALKQTGHYENSVIIFTTDNGGSFKMGASNWPLRGAKANLLEGGTRGAAIIHSPLLPNPGKVYNQLFFVTDWFSTITALSRGQPSRAVDGVDQWNALAGFADPPRDKFIYNIDDTVGKFRAAIRFNDLKLSVGRVGNKDWEPHYPLALTARTHFYIFPGDYINSNESKDIFSEFSVSSNPWIRNSSRVDNSVLLVSTDKESSFLTEVFEGNEKFLSSEDHGKEEASRSPRLRHPFSTEFGRISQKKKKHNIGKKVPAKPMGTKTKTYLEVSKKINTKTKQKRPLTLKLKNRENHNTQEKMTNKKETINKKPNKTNKKSKKEKKKRKKAKKKKKMRRKKKPNDKEVITGLRVVGHVKWNYVRDNTKLSWDPQVLRQLESYLDGKTKIRLYNITDDPSETKDLSIGNMSVIQTMLNYLASQLNRFVPMQPKRYSARGLPEKWGNVWTPGWCKAQ